MPSAPGIALQHLPMGDGLAAALRGPPSCRGHAGGGRSAVDGAARPVGRRPRRRRGSRAGAGRCGHGRRTARRAWHGRGRSSPPPSARWCPCRAGARCRAAARRRCRRGSSPQWAISAFTSVPVALPAAGWTTSPRGLSMTMIASSSNTMLSGISSAAGAAGSGGGSATVMVSPALTRWPGSRTVRPPTVTSPARISALSRERDRSAIVAASTRSSRSPAFASATTTVLGAMINGHERFAA